MLETDIFCGSVSIIKSPKGDEGMALQEIAMV
jgi:hypothetical protein